MKLLFTAVAVLISLLAKGAVLMALWSWYGEPLGLPAIDLAEAIGIGLLVSLLTWSYSLADAEAISSAESRWAVIAASFLTGMLTWGFLLAYGAILQLFV